MNPVLRWAGSKRKLVGTLRSLAPRDYCRYFEPFAGSAVLFFDLLPKRATLGDLNPEVIATYVAIKSDPASVISHLRSIPQTSEAYYTLRALDTTTLIDVERAARLIFLMKSCFNGVYRTNKAGNFNVPLGNRFFALPSDEDISAISAALKNVTILNGDFESAIASAAPGDFIYLDPPYSDGSRFRGEYSYQGSFKEEDQERLIRVCKSLSGRGIKVLMSFKDCDNLTRELSGWSFTRLDVARSVAGFAHSRRVAREILVCNY